MLNETATSAVTMRLQGTRRHSIVVCCALRALLGEAKSNALHGSAGEAGALSDALSALWRRIDGATAEEQEESTVEGTSGGRGRGEGSGGGKEKGGSDKGKGKQKSAGALAEGSGGSQDDAADAAAG